MLFENTDFSLRGTDMPLDYKNESLVRNINASLYDTNKTFTVTPEQEGEGWMVIYYILSVLGILITLGTILGNVLVIVAVIKEKKLRKVGNVFVINLALSDCLVGVFVSPLAIAYEMKGEWTFSWTFCDIWIGMDVICCTASILNLCAISYDRCNAILNPIKYSRKRTFSRAWVIVVIVWFYSISIVAPSFFLKNDSIGSDLLRGDERLCFITKHIGYTIYSTTGAFFVPLIVMTYYYMKIYLVTNSRRSKWRRRRSCGSFRRQTSLEGSEIRGCCFECCKGVKDEESTCPEVVDASTQAQLGQPGESKAEEAELIPLEEESRRESIEPALLAIYQMRQRSTRNMSQVTTSSFGSSYYSSTDSSRTATTSFSSDSDRSQSISSARSSSTSTQGSRSYSFESGRLYSNILKSHRVSGGRQLRTEVIHELVVSQANPFNEVLPTDIPEDTEKINETADDGNDEESDEPTAKQKTRRVLKSATFRKRNSRKRTKIALSQEKRAAKTLGIVMSCFVMCWLPFFVITLIRPFCDSCFFHRYLIQGITWMGYFNSACNPVIYSFFNKDFRNAFKKMTAASRSNEFYF